MLKKVFFFFKYKCVVKLFKLFINDFVRCFIFLVGNFFLIRFIFSIICICFFIIVVIVWVILLFIVYFKKVVIIF